MSDNADLEHEASALAWKKEYAPGPEGAVALRKPAMQAAPTALAGGYVFGGTRMNTGIRTEAPPLSRAA